MSTLRERMERHAKGMDRYDNQVEAIRGPRTNVGADIRETLKLLERARAESFHESTGEPESECYGECLRCRLDRAMGETR